MDEKRINELMKTFGCTREEAISVIQEDEEIEHMTVKELNSDLTAEQRKAVKDATKTGTRKSGTVKRERKVDTIKKRLITAIKTLLEGIGAQVETLTTEAEMHFTFEGENYTIKLIKHRAPKG